jgi:hypothetical protein
MDVFLPWTFVHFSWWAFLSSIFMGRGEGICRYVRFGQSFQVSKVALPSSSHQPCCFTSFPTGLYWLRWSQLIGLAFNLKVPLYGLDRGQLPHGGGGWAKLRPWSLSVMSGIRTSCICPFSVADNTTPQSGVFVLKKVLLWFTVLEVHPRSRDHSWW